MRAFLVCIAPLCALVSGVALAQQAPPCADAEKYEAVHFGVDAKPLILSRIHGRTVVQAPTGEIRVNELPEGVCLSLFTADSHRFLRSTGVNGKGHFDFGPVPPGRYRLIARARGFCTGNVAVKVSAPPAPRHSRSMIVLFQIAQLDVRTGADYDRTE